MPTTSRCASAAPSTRPGCRPTAAISPSARRGCSRARRTTAVGWLSTSRSTCRSRAAWAAAPPTRPRPSSRAITCGAPGSVGMSCSLSLPSSAPTFPSRSWAARPSAQAEATASRPRSRRAPSTGCSPSPTPDSRRPRSTPSSTARVTAASVVASTLSRSGSRLVLRTGALSAIRPSRSTAMSGARPPSPTAAISAVVGPSSIIRRSSVTPRDPGQ